MKELEHARDAVTHVSELTGSLCLGTIESICATIFPELLREYHRLYPKVNIRLITDSPETLLEMMNSNAIDIVYFLDKRMYDSKWIKVLEEPEDILNCGIEIRVQPPGKALKVLSLLSGGEKVRCMLSRMMLFGSNALVLDQPTNHLDLESITAVNNGLIDFKGVVLFASHDHEFVQTIANRVMEFVDGKLIDKMCTYDAYIAGAREEMLARLNG